MKTGFSDIWRAIGRDSNVAQVSGKESVHTCHGGLGRRVGFELRKIVSWLLGEVRGRGAKSQLNGAESF